MTDTNQPTETDAKEEPPSLAMSDATAALAKEDPPALAGVHDLKPIDASEHESAQTAYRAEQRNRLAVAILLVLGAIGLGGGSLWSAVQVAEEVLTRAPPPTAIAIAALSARSLVALGVAGIALKLASVAERMLIPLFILGGPQGTSRTRALLGSRLASPKAKTSRRKTKAKPPKTASADEGEED